MSTMLLGVLAFHAPFAMAQNTRRDPVKIAAQIDLQIDRLLSEAKIPASPLADDAEFIRRASLDIRGRIPTANRVAKFLRDTDPNKRAKLIDEFLADPEYGEHFAVTWYHRIVKPTGDNRWSIQYNKLHEWLADRFNKNRSWDSIVTEMLTAKGARDRNPEITFWLASIGDEKLGQPEPSLATAAVSRLFMGVRLECCECHNHPSTTLKQTDFWAVAAFFGQTRADGASKKAAKNGEEPKVFEQIEFTTRKMERLMKDRPKVPVGSIAVPYGNGKIVKARFLGGDSPEVNKQTQLRATFAEWLTSASNPYFSRAAVNVLWANFFGRGIVNPIDDMLAESRNTHPELLTLLSEEFAAARFDQKHLIRCITSSKAYQRTSKPLTENKEDNALYSRMPLKIMTADMLYDSLAVALNRRVGGTETRYPKKGSGGPRDEFRKFFHAEADDDAGVVEEYSHGIPQVLRLMNSKELIDPTQAVTKLMRKNNAPEQVIEDLYLTVLSRRPTSTEVQRALKYVSSDQDVARGYRDLMWAMLNTSEFLFNH
jgi:hypothetical protein